VSVFIFILKLALNKSGVGVFFSRQDAGLLSAKPDSGNCLAFYNWWFITFSPARTGVVFCLSRRQQPSAPWMHRGDHLAVKKTPR
jgi:hypothetical protein